MLSPMACPALQYFSTLSRKLGGFWKKSYRKQNAWLDFSTNLSETFLILIRTKRDMIMNVHNLQTQFPLFLSGLIENWTFSTDFRLMKIELSRQIFENIFKYKISWNYVQWESSLSTWRDRRTDGRTCMTKLIVAFRNSANVSNKVNADQRFVEQFSHQCSRDVKFPLNMVDKNFSGSSVFAFC